MSSLSARYTDSPAVDIDFNITPVFYKIKCKYQFDPIVIHALQCYLNFKEGNLCRRSRITPDRFYQCIQEILNRMKLFDRYFQSYEEYCIRTTFPEDELKEILKKECPAATAVFSWKVFKALTGLEKTVLFSRDPADPFHLVSIKFLRNSAGGDLFIHAEKATDGETILHIVIGPDKKYKYSLYGMCIFAFVWGIAASFVVWWFIFVPIPFIGFLLIVMECCRAAAMDEATEIRQDFEVMLRALERKNL